MEPGQRLIWVNDEAPFVTARYPHTGTPETANNKAGPWLEVPERPAP